MGIQNRDYMRRARQDDGPRSTAPDDRVEAFLSGFLQRHRRLLIGSGIALAVLTIVAVAIAIFF
jgi:hypothetical protein